MPRAAQARPPKDHVGESEGPRLLDGPRDLGRNDHGVVEARGQTAGQGQRPDLSRLGSIPVRQVRGDIGWRSLQPSERVLHGDWGRIRQGQRRVQPVVEGHAEACGHLPQRRPGRQARRRELHPDEREDSFNAAPAVTDDARFGQQVRRAARHHRGK